MIGSKKNITITFWVIRRNWYFFYFRSDQKQDPHPYPFKNETDRNTGFMIQTSMPKLVNSSTKIRTLHFGVQKPIYTFRRY